MNGIFRYDHSVLEGRGSRWWFGKALKFIFNTYMLFAGWEVRIVKNCDRGLENAARGRRPRVAFSRRRSQFFTIRTDPKPVNNLILLFFLRTKDCSIFCKHRDKISRKRYRGPWADIGESCPR